MDNTDDGPVQQEMRGTVLVLTLRNPPVNALGFAVRTAIAKGLDRAEGDAAITAVVICGAGRGF